jgi:AcrR family transcriptional regulator
MVNKLPPETPRARRRAANLERILEAAMKLIIEGGLDACSIHKVAAEVDYSPAALYRYFDSKDALLSAVVVRVLRELETDLRNAAESVSADHPLATIRAVCLAYARFASLAPHRFGLLSLMMVHPGQVFHEEDGARPAIRAMLSALTPLTEILERNAQAQQLHSGDASERALTLFAGIQGILQLRKQSLLAPEVIDLESLLNSLLRTLLIGWGADPTSIDRSFEHVSPRQLPPSTWNATS